MEKDKVLKNLSDLSNVLEELGLTWWCEAGTCLGIYRNHRFIPWDQDVDVGLLAEEIDTTDKLLEFFKIAIDNGFRIYHTFGTLKNGFELCLIKRGIKNDVFWFYKNGKIRWHSAWKNGGRDLEKDQIIYEYPAKIIEKRKKDYFKGIKIFLPKKTETYLETKYGTDWRIPTRKWNWATSPRNKRDKA